MPTQIYTLSFFHALAGPSSTWEAVWDYWDIILPILSPASDDISFEMTGATRNVGYFAGAARSGATRPTTDSQVLLGGIATGDASIAVFSSVPVYIGLVSGKGHQWQISVQTTTPDYFHVGSQKYPNYGEVAFVPAQFQDVWVTWRLTHAVSDAGSFLIPAAVFQGGVSLYPQVAARPTVSQEILVSDTTVHAAATASSPQGAIAFYGWQIRDEAGHFLGTSVGDSGGHPWGPYAALGQTIDYELPGEGTYSIRCIVFDEHGYVSGTNWGDSPGGEFQEFTISGAQFGSILDATGMLYSAVNDGDDVQVSRFPAGAASRELLAVIANAKNPSYAYNRNNNRHFVSYEDRADGAQKMVQSESGGRDFT